MIREAIQKVIVGDSPTEAEMVNAIKIFMRFSQSRLERETFTQSV